MKSSAAAFSLLLTAVATLTLPASLQAQQAPAMAKAHVDPGVLTLACAPMAATAGPTAALRVTGGQDTQVRETFAQGDFVTITGGANQGIQIGQEFFVRRLLAPRGAVSAQNPGTTRTVGWVKVYAIDEDLALATITHNCDAMRVGDYLEPLALPVPRRAEATRGKPERDYARVILGNERRTEFGPGDYLVIDRGTEQGIAPGTQLVFYRWKTKSRDNFLAAIAEGVAVDVQAGTATVTITSSRDAVKTGDLAAMRKEKE
jgi:hypothetical protein